MVRTEYVDFKINAKLKKDLQEHEVVCPDCNGTGLQIHDNSYGLGEPDKEHFPYKNQVIASCMNCYNGVQKKCKHCGKLLGGNSYCNCEGAKIERDIEHADKNAEKWAKSEKITIEEAINRKIGMIYCEDFDAYIMTDELDEWIEEKKENLKFDGEEWHMPYFYGTENQSISFDAYNIISSACEDLHEDAYDSISDNRIKEFQAYLDKLADELEQDTKTYYPDWEIGIIVE